MFDTIKFIICRRQSIAELENPAIFEYNHAKRRIWLQITIKIEAWSTSKHNRGVLVY